MAWDTSCLDWEQRLLSGRAPIPELPLFEDEAARALRIFKRLQLPDVIGTPRMGDAAGPWFFKIVQALFGAYDVEENRRMIQELFLLVPKKNMKSTGAAGIMVTAAIVNRRPEAEFTLVAPTIEVTGIAYKQAKGIIKRDPELDKLFQIRDHIKTIQHRKTGAYLQIKAADTDVITGSKSTGTLIDETHVFAKRANAADIFVELRGALAARPDGFLIQITTQSKDPPAGVFKQELNTARDVRDGVITLPLLPVLYEIPARLSKDGGWKERKYWPLVNPNMGRSVDEQFLENQLIKAERDGPHAMALLASQHFNVEVGVGLRSDGWVGAELWQRGIDRSVTLEALIERCDVITVGIDGGGLDDLLGLAAIGREKVTKNWLGWTKAFISPEGLERRKANRSTYDGFESSGDLVYVKALPADVVELVAIIGRINETGLLAEVGVDSSGLGIIVDALADIDITEENENLVGVRQGFGLMDAIKTIERKLADGSFKHAGQALMSWCVGNAIVQPTPTGMRIVRDASGFGKIDPLMALFDAAALMARNPEAPGSVYEERDLLFI